MDLLDSSRIYTEQPLPKPCELLSELFVSNVLTSKITEARQVIRNIIKGTDKRLLVIVGPCSIHDTKAALEYANLLREAAIHFNDELFIVMRTYFDKPRTVLGWRGLITDPYLNGSFAISDGLKLSRKLLIDLAEIGLPTATEFLDTIMPQYLSDLISWVAIGARTSQSQIHRELASSLAIPVGFKNNTDGNMKIAVDAVSAAGHPHHFIGINKEGCPAILSTQGNPHCHIVLRGSNRKSNYNEEDLQEAISLLQGAHLTPRFLIDCSHGNSGKNHNNQQLVIEHIIKYFTKYKKNICGVMLESNLISANQALEDNQKLIYGQSITDACISWSETYPLLERLAEKIRYNQQDYSEVEY